MTSLGDKFETLEDAFNTVYVYLREIDPTPLDDEGKTDLHVALVVAETFTDLLNGSESWTKAKEVLQKVTE